MRLTIDFETRSPVDIKKCGPWVYAEHPDTDVLCLAVMTDQGGRGLWANPKQYVVMDDDPDSWTNESWLPIRRFVDRADEIEAHNAEFERAIWKRIMVARYGWPEIPEHKWRCSAAKAAAHALPRSLEGAAAALNLPVQKDMDGKKVMLKLCRPRKPPTEKQQEKEWAAAATEIVREIPLYAAIAHIQSAGKISAKSFLKDYDRETVKEIHGKHPGLVSPSGILQADEIAHDYGFGTLDAFVEELKRAKPAKVVIAEYFENMRAEWYAGPERELLWHENPEDFRRLFQYCIRDVETEHALSTALDDLIPIEQEVWHLDQAMNERGFRVDPREVRGIIGALATHEETLLGELRELTWGTIQTAKQAAAMASFCGTGDMKAATVAEALNGNLDPTTRRVLEIRQVLGLSSVAKYKSMLENICYDGRIRSTLMYHGAGTGRWAGKRVQPQNFPRFTVAPDDVPLALELFGDCELVALQNCLGDPAEIAKGLLRPVIQAAPGCDLVCDDFAGIEMRVLFWLAGEKEALEIVRTGADIYCDMASTIYDRVITKKDKEERQVGKACILGSGYGMGPPKFRLTAKVQSGIDLDKKMARKVIRAYRKKYPNVPQYWYSTERAAVDCVLTGEPQTFEKVTWLRDGRFLFAELPSGRRIAYPFPQVDVEPAFIFPAIDDEGEPAKIMIVGDPKTANKRAKKRAEDEGLMIIGPAVAKEKHVLKYWGVVDGRWQREATYGGKLTENVDQGISRDILAAAMLRLKAAGYCMILSVHDEAIAEVPEGFGSLEEFEEIMREVPPWAEGLPVAVEGFRSKRYRK